jgi:trans-2,3-dihydro-3-hydroxyanthranilate isomerase
MKRLSYHLVDVFTDRAFGGNPLAVFMDGGTVPESIMQPIAKELNLSETTFVLPPRDPKNHYRVRIFTPGAELPMAGHPTVGTAFILARAGFVRPAGQPTRITFEEGVGPIGVSIAWKDNAADFIEMRQPLPQFGPPLQDIDAIAEMLSINPSAIRLTNLPLQVVSCGVPYFFVPVDSLKSIRQIRFRLDLYEKLWPTFAAHGVFIFTREVEFAGSHIHSRMFAPGLGVMEDPATGSATGPLGCYLVRHQVLASEGELRCVNEQGIELGRPSFLHLRITHAKGEISAVRVGGRCHYMGCGELELPNEQSR